MSTSTTSEPAPPVAGTPEHDAVVWAARFAALPAAHLAFYARRAWSRDHYMRPRCTGVSSDALTLYALGLGPLPSQSSYPHDASDLAACELTYTMAPPDVATAMVPTLALYRAATLAHLQDQARDRKARA